MFHRVFPVGPLQCNCSVIADEQTHEAMVIDPGDEVEQILELLREKQFVLKQIAVTHAHIDHIGGGMKLKKTTRAPPPMKQNDHRPLQMLHIHAPRISTKPPGTHE